MKPWTTAAVRALAVVALLTASPVLAQQSADPDEAAAMRALDAFLAGFNSRDANVTGGLAPITTPLVDMFMFTVEGENFSLQERRTILDWMIRPVLRTLPGVAEVNTIGGLVLTFEVEPDHHALAAHGISFAMLQQAIQANNHNDGAGSLSDGDEALLVRTEGNITTYRMCATLSSPAMTEARFASVMSRRCASAA